LAAHQTAEALNIPALIEPELRECNYGRWAGKPINDIETDDPAGLAQWLCDPAACPHGGETLLAVLGRVSCWLDEQQGSAGLIVAITHASIVRAAIVCALDAPPLAFWRIDISPMSVTWLHGGKHSWTLSSINESLPRTQMF
jgi:broad specificity phosphatase PhoE